MNFPSKISYRAQVVSYLAEKPELDGENKNESEEKSSNCSGQAKALDQLRCRQVIRLQSLDRWLHVFHADISDISDDEG